MAEVFAYAKINLFLDIEKKREDGYHDIVSVMQTVDWYDILNVRKNTENKKEITLICENADIPTDETNTVYKAASLFLKKIGTSDGMDITIEKNIPHAAGMAGGSADAAATLRELNRMYGDPLSNNELLLLGKQIGADVPFCIAGGTMLTTGIGEKMIPLSPLPPCFLVCAKLGEGISTPKAYSALDTKHRDFRDYSVHQKQFNALEGALKNQNIFALPSGLYNVFEEVAETERPAVSLLKTSLLKNGALGAMMSGSGPSVFGVFNDQVTAERACLDLASLGAVCKVCTPIGSL